MATPFQALVDEIRGLDGAPKVTYPEGVASCPVVERVLRIKRGEHLPTFGQPDPDTGRFPNSKLTEQTEMKSEQSWVEVYRKYEVMPGPISLEVSQFQNTGIPVLVARRKVAAPDDYDEGEIVPVAVDVTGISVAASGVSTITLADAHDLPPRAWVTFAGTDSTPSINGQQRIIGVPAPNQVQIAAAVTGAGTTGTMQAINRVIRELKPTGNVNILMKVESMVAVPSLTPYNENIGCWKEYSFPDFLKALVGYRDLGIGSSGGATEYSFSFTGGGSFGLQIQNGYRGPCKARRLRIFSMGPVSDAVVAEYTPTFVMPCSGTVVIESESYSEQGTTGGTASSFSFTYKAGTIPPLMGSARTAVDSFSGAGQAEFFVDFPGSSPTHFTAGDIITLLETPQKLDVGLWELFIWQLFVPYTSGQPANERTYTFRGAGAGGGSISVPGLLSGDVIQSVVNVTAPPTMGSYLPSFASPIATLDTLVQTDTADLSAFTFQITVHQ